MEHSWEHQIPKKDLTILSPQEEKKELGLMSLVG
jgi:hypothetical protein